jgi:acetylornithine deacetylase/succinyl-diaminopimelate desuccinylase family protein
MLTDLETKLHGDLDEKGLVALLGAMVKAPSVSGDEKPAVDVLARWLKREGFEVSIEDAAPGRPNIVAQWGPNGTKIGGVTPARNGGDGPVLLLTGHSDTVPIGNGWTQDPFGGAIDGDKLYGRGSCDMKAGLAAMAYTLAGIRRAFPNPNGTVIFAACVDEEENGIGTQAAIRAGLSADWAVIGEPTELQPIRACKGDCYFEIAVGGVAAHAGSPDAGVNAIYGAADAIRIAQAHDKELRHHRHNLLGSPTLSVGTIKGGMITSAVPDSCTVTVDRRLLPHETGASALAQLQRALDRDLERRDGLTHKLELKMELPPSEVDEGHPLVQALARAGRDSGAPPLPVGGWGAASDGGYLMRDAKTPTVLFGPGSITGQAHRPDEYVSIEQTIVSAKTYMTLAARVLTKGLQ